MLLLLLLLLLLLCYFDLLKANLKIAMKKIIPLVFTLLLTDVALACKPVPPHVGMIGPLNAKKSLIVTSANQHYFLSSSQVNGRLRRGGWLEKETLMGWHLKLHHMVSPSRFGVSSIGMYIAVE